MSFNYNFNAQEKEMGFQEHKVSKCKYCTENVKWITTQKNGKQMPLDLEALEWDEVKEGQVVVNEYGETVRKSRYTDNDENENLLWYVSHFATCEGYKR